MVRQGTINLGTIVALLTISLVAGCASVSTTQEYGGSDLPRPEHILVHRFAVDADDVSLNRGFGAELKREIQDTPETEEEKKIGRAVAEALAKKMVEEINALGLPATIASHDVPVDGNALIIEGQFVSIDQGNQATRMVLGLGFGRSHVKTHVQVYDQGPSGRKLVEKFETVAESPMKPGMAMTMEAGAAAGNAATAAVASVGTTAASESLGASVEAEAATTAKKLVKELADFFNRQGWID